jgi:hypothetical protein
MAELEHAKVVVDEVAVGTSFVEEAESMQSQQEADVDALEQHEEARYGLVDAINAKNEALNQGKMPRTEGEL